MKSETSSESKLDGHLHLFPSVPFSRDRSKVAQSKLVMDDDWMYDLLDSGPEGETADEKKGRIDKLKRDEAEDKKRSQAFFNGHAVKRDTLEVLKHSRWHYADHMMNGFPHDGVPTPAVPSHVEFMEKRKLYRDKFTAWLQETEFALDRVPIPLYKVIRSYLEDGGHKLISQYYGKGISPVNEWGWKTLNGFIHMWGSSPFIGELFDDAVVFEGRPVANERFHTDDGPMEVGKSFVRRRPTSTTWSLNAATWFMRGDASVLFVHHVRDPTLKALNAQFFQRRGFGSEWNECEVLLQPGCKFTITKVESEPPYIESYNRNRSAHCSGRIRPRLIVHTVVTTQTEPLPELPLPRIVLKPTAEIPQPLTAPPTAQPTAHSAMSERETTTVREVLRNLNNDDAHIVSGLLHLDGSADLSSSSDDEPMEEEEEVTPAIPILVLSEGELPVAVSVWRPFVATCRLFAFANSKHHLHSYRLHNGVVVFASVDILDLLFGHERTLRARMHNALNSHLCQFIPIKIAWMLITVVDVLFRDDPIAVAASIWLRVVLSYAPRLELSM